MNNIGAEHHLTYSGGNTPYKDEYDWHKGERFYSKLRLNRSLHSVND